MFLFSGNVAGPERREAGPGSVTDIAVIAVTETRSVTSNVIRTQRRTSHGNRPQNLHTGQ